MPDEVLLALSTFPDHEIARKISDDLVRERFVACANIVPEIESVYFWEGKVENSNEVLVLFKLSVEAYEAFERKLKSLHPYDVPEIIAIPVVKGSVDYLGWVRANSSPVADPLA
jgi:periplasmic divalent cation tolerance protein